jgi:uncharacterized protein (DUF2252 family)
MVIACWLTAAWFNMPPTNAEPAVTTVPASLSGSQLAPSPYDLLESNLRDFVPINDAAGWAMKVYSLRDDPYRFWRGAKDLFAAWCREHAADWIADRDVVFPAHGDLHLGNIGTYHAGQFGQLAFGMVDFDDACLLPYQLELLSGLVTMELIAEVNGIELDDARRRDLAGQLVEQFVAAAAEPDRAAERLASIPAVRKLLDRAGKRTYQRMLEELVEDGRFRRVLTSGGGEVREILRPIDDRRGEVASLLEQATWNNQRFASLVRYRKGSQWQKAIRSVALRTRVGSAGSQGLEKILVLVERPFVGVDHDGVFYLKQQIPTAFERERRRGRAAFLHDPPPRGNRVVELMDQMCRPPPLFSSYAEQSGPGPWAKAYWVTVREPWSDELDHKDVKTLDDLRQAADIWALVAGAAAGRCGLRHGQIDTPEGRNKLVEQLLDRGPRFVRWMNEQYEQFLSDPRVSEQVRRAREFIDAAAR